MRAVDAEAHVRARALSRALARSLDTDWLLAEDATCARVTVRALRS
jgi:hypothetical protein